MNNVKFNTFKSKFKNASKKAVAVVAASASTAALAVDDAVVTAAQTAGEASVLNATNGLIAIVAIVVGLSLVIGLMRRS